MIATEWHATASVGSSKVSSPGQSFGIEHAAATEFARHAHSIAASFVVCIKDGHLVNDRHVVHPVVKAYTMSPTKRRNDSFSTNCL